MKFGNIEVRLGANEIIIGAVVVITLSLLWTSPSVPNSELFKIGFQSLIAWGAGYAMGTVKKGEVKE